MFAPLGWISRPLQQEMYHLFESSELFDPRWYRAQLKGVELLQDPIWHYIYIGWLRGFSPSAGFDPRYYSDKYVDLQRARVNPLHHYLKYGKQEGRLPLRSNIEIVDHHIPESSSVRSFITPSLGTQRLSVLIDSNSAHHCEIPAQEIIALCSTIASVTRSHLRILLRGISLDPSEIDRALASAGNQGVPGLEITPIPVTFYYSDIPVFDDEKMIATSWSSSQALRHHPIPEYSWCLTPKTPEKKTSCETVPLPSEVNFPKTLDLFLNSVNFRKIMQSEYLAWPDTFFAPSASFYGTRKENRSQMRIGVFCQPGPYPGIFSLSVEALNEWLLFSSLKPEDVELVFFDQEIPPFHLASEFIPRFVQSSGEGSDTNDLDCAVVFSRDAAELAGPLLGDGADVVHVSPENSGVTVLPQPGSNVLVATSPALEDISKAMVLLENRQQGGREVSE